MKLSDLIGSYVSQPRLKAKLKHGIKLDNGERLKKGTVSDLLIKKDNNTYHFEANNTACTVTVDEIEFI
jgi:hypothetical protein